AKHPGVIAAVPYIESEALLTNGKRVTGATVRGVLPEEERKATGLADHLKAGRLEDLKPRSRNVILGSALARDLDAKVGGTVVIMAPEGTATPVGVMPRMLTFHVSGIFEFGMFEFDKGLALINMSDAALLYRLGDDVTGIRMALADP